MFFTKSTNVSNEVVGVQEVVFLGTGTSSCIPNATCLIPPNSCAVCHDAMHTANSRNRRRNTSALIKHINLNGQVQNILIDCGKTFYESTLSHFVRHKIQKVHAVVLTHGHADAYFGLDDLRAWSDGGSIDVFLSEETYEVVAKAFPYLVDSAKATGGGEVPSLKFHTFTQHTNYFMIGDAKCIPVPVHHGKAGKEPFYCFGFRFDDFTYVSDTNYIPTSSQKRIQGSKVIVMDALKDTPHASHFGVREALQELESYRASCGLLTGMCHLLDHNKLSRQLADEARKNPRLPQTLVPAFDGMVVKFLASGPIIESER